MKKGMEYYDATAKTYNELHGEEQQRKAQIILAHVNIKPSDTILDVGCGTGIALKNVPGRITGIDPSDELRKQAPFPTVKGTAESLPFEDKSFDIVLSITAIHHSANPKQAIAEMKRVAKRSIIITVLKKSRGYDTITSLIKSNLNAAHEIDDLHDTIFIAKV